MRIPGTSIAFSSRTSIQKTPTVLFRFELIAALAAVIFLVAPAGVFAQPDSQSNSELDARKELDALNKRVIELYNAGKITEAIPLAEQYLKTVENRFGQNHPLYARSLNNLALLYYTQRRYAEAEPLYKRALAMREKALPEGHPDIATSLNNLAGLYIEQEEWPQALTHARRAAAILISRAAVGDSGPKVAAKSRSAPQHFECSSRPLPISTPTIQGCGTRVSRWRNGRRGHRPRAH